MVAIKPLSHYGPVIMPHGKELDMRKLERLHETVGKYRDEFLTNDALQDVLMNGGYELERERRPQSFLDIRDGTILRTQAVLSKTVVDHAIDVVTKPQMWVMPAPTLWIPGQGAPEERPTTAQGYDFERIEDLQRQWAEDTQTVTAVRKFQSELEEALDPFNMKFIINSMVRIKPRLDRKENDKATLIEREIERVIFPEGYSALDSAYYVRGRSQMNAVARAWEELQKSEFGKFFTLTAEEVRRYTFKRNPAAQED